MLTAEKLLASFPKNIKVDDPDNIDATLQLSLFGEGGGDWCISISNGEGVLRPGIADNPVAVVRMGASDYVDMIQGRLDSFVAYRSGRLSVTGDHGTAMKIRALFGI